MNDNTKPPAGEPIEFHDRDEPRFYYAVSSRGHAIFYNPGPNQLRWPILFASEDLTHPEATMPRIAKILTEHWEIKP